MVGSTYKSAKSCVKKQKSVCCFALNTYFCEVKPKCTLPNCLKPSINLKALRYLTVCHSHNDKNR